MPKNQTNIMALLLLLFFFTKTSIIAQDSINIQKHLNYLGSDLFQGRAPGSLGGELSAKYIALHLNQNDLIPFGYENTFYQYVPMHKSKPTDNSKLILVGKRQDTLYIKNDFLFYHTGGRIFTPNPIPSFFVGYGIIAPEFNYSDYKDINVEGKIVVYIEGEPYSDNPNYFKGTIPSNYSFADTKQKIALSKGAVGTIQIPNQFSEQESNWDKLIHEYYFEDISLAYLPTPLLGILLNPSIASLFFRDSKYSFNDVKMMYQKQELKSFELKNKLLLKSEFIRKDFVSPNIVGYLKGSDAKLKHEFIVLSAHYDHLGIGLPVESDSIYNGVLDNAIGVAALLELARLFSQNDFELKRSLLFLFTTGEEEGLLGSTYFIDHTPIPKERIIANVNIDGLAMFGNFNSIIGIGAELSNLDVLLKKVADRNNITVEKISEQFDSYESFLRSDQLAFASADIPSILISDGLSYDKKKKDDIIALWKDYIANRYHSPFDDLSQKIVYKASIKHIKILYDFIEELANSEFEIKWNEPHPFQRVKN